MNKIIKGDRVIVVSGKDKGKIGAVLSVRERKVVVEGVNLVKKHAKPNPIRGVEGGIVEKSLPIDISNVAIFNPHTERADRVCIKLISGDGVVRRIRVFKSNDVAINVQKGS
ncbi:50S ribosomal protein L24 [Kingella potus]|uniref:50S ribosomal protein L24 n=1 Tax=Kingella potus TaxID=265175 RepID=UPI000E1BD463|nr:50S ribosomal protein L24 [Kingella potus]UOP00622.1 50S ribosomal protein L24 [Kingella potus]